MSDYIARLKNVTLNYRFVRDISLKQFIQETFFLKGERDRIREITALDNISLDFEKGKNYGIIGMNGAGKSTLLKLIANIFQPDHGEVIVNTPSVSLLTLGTGFIAELNGIENIYLNALLLGLSKSEIDDKIDEIVDFADIGDFIYQPIKTYSTGMRSRVAFSTVINVKPELLLIDEVMGVGDDHFRFKSQKQLNKLIRGERSVIIVSHSMPYVKDNCDQVIWLDEGRVQFVGDTSIGVTEYNKFIRSMRNKKLN